MKKLCGKVMCILLSTILYVGTLTLATADLLEAEYEVTVEESDNAILQITYNDNQKFGKLLFDLEFKYNISFLTLCEIPEEKITIIQCKNIGDKERCADILAQDNNIVEDYESPETGQIYPSSIEEIKNNVEDTANTEQAIQIDEDYKIIQLNVEQDEEYIIYINSPYFYTDQNLSLTLYDQDEKIMHEFSLNNGDRSLSVPKIITYLEAGVYYLELSGAQDQTLYSEINNGDGTSSNPFRIRTIEDLNNLRYLDDPFRLFYYAQQLNNIYFLDEDYLPGGTYYNDGKFFEPINNHVINSMSEADVIVYKGQGHIIDNLKINRPNENDVALFSMDLGASDLHLTNADVKGKNHVAGISASRQYPVLNGCSAGGTIQGNDFVAGLAVENLSMERCANYAHVIGNKYVGGLVAQAGSLTEYFGYSDLYNAGKIEGNDQVGGVFGAYRDEDTFTSEFNNIYNSGEVLSDATNKGSVVGYIEVPFEEQYIKNTNLNLDKGVPASPDSNLNQYFNGLSEAEMRLIESYVGFDFTNVWTIDLDASYPYPTLQGHPLYDMDELKPIESEYEKYTHKINLSHTSSNYLSSNGKLFTWGDNRLGQLGNETFSSREYPKELSIDSDVKIKKVVSGEAHSMALSEDGNVYLWGSNQFGQLGDGTLNNKLVPFHLPFNGSVQDIAAAGNQSFVLTETGKVFAWGKNNYGQLGDGTEEDKHIPTEITAKFDGEEIIEIVPGEYCTFAMSTSGKLFGWGYNTKNNLGDSSHFRRIEPYDLSFLFNRVKISHLSAAYQHTLAVTSDGDLYVWGYNEFGQLGVSASEIGPTNISSLFDDEKIDKAFAGGTTSYVITKSGRVFAWGSNDKGQLADGSTVNRNMPYEITSKFEGKRVIDIGAKKRHAYAETADGDIYFWGENIMGQLGNQTKQDSLTPINITKSFTKYIADSGLVFLSNSRGYQSPYFISEVSRFDGHVIANDIPISNFVFYSPDLIVDVQSGIIEQTSDGKYSVYAVLKSKIQQVGTDYLNPVYQEYVIPFTVIVREIGEQIAASTESSAYLDPNGKLYLWGNNNRSQLLEDDIYYRSNLPIDVTAKMQDRIIDIKSGNYHSLILTERGEVFSWGFNYNGQLGNGDTVNSKELIKVPLQNIIAIDAGANQSFAINKDGHLFAWGLNNYNQLGIGNETDCYEPVQVSIESVSQIIAGNFSTFALTDDGKVYAWGYNSKGNLGDGSNLRRQEPFEITDKFAGEQVVKLTAGAQHAAALTANGQVYIWGYNDQGQLGTEIDGFSKLPLNITQEFEGNVRDIFAGGNATSVLMEDGKWFVFGANDKGQLGLGHTAEQKLPVENGANVGDIQKISMHFSHTLILSDDLYASGLNDRGQLGDESYVNRLHPVKVKFFKDIPANYGNVRTRYNSVYYLTDDHKVYVWGENAQGELGDGTFETRFSPLDITDKFGEEKVIKLEPGAALSESGKIFIWGEERARILGGTNYDNVNIPTVFPYNFPAKIVDLYSSGRYYYAIDENDRVYFWGTNPVANKWSEQLIPQDVTAQFDNKKIDYFLLKDDFAIAVTKDKCIYGWGSNVYGALGDKVSANEQKTPMNITSYLEGHTLKKAAAGDRHVFVLTEEGQLYAWGYNGFCQIENSTSSKVTPKNTASQFDGTIADVFAGSFQSGVLTQEGKLYVFGDNREGSLGHIGDGKELFDIGVNLGDSLPMQICFCSSTSIISTEDGRLFSSGNNTYGQLGIEQNSNSFFPIEIPFVLYRNTTAQPISMIAGKSLDYNYNIASYKTGSLELINSGIDNNLFRFYSQNPNIVTVDESTGRMTAKVYGRTKIYAVLAARIDRINGDFASLANKNYFVEFEVVVRNADNSFHKDLKVKYKKDDKFTVAITSPMLDIKDKIFTVTYGSQLVLDALSPNTGITLGNHIEILSNNNNVLKFQLKNTAPAVTKGLVAKVTFKALESGSSDIEIKVETKED